MNFKKTKFLGTGIGLPEKVLHNFDLEKMVDTSDEWIFERTGIKERRISSPDKNEFPTDLALTASRQAIENANLSVDDIDLILFASVTPDVKLPNSASILQTKLGMTKKCACLDIAAACSGFVYGLNMAKSMIATGDVNNVLIVGAEMLSREVDWTDRTMCILFGDGCGAAVIGPEQEDGPSEVFSGQLGADGKGREFFDQPVGGAVTPITEEHLRAGNHYMQMKGKEMFKVATRTLSGMSKEVLAKANLSVEDVDWFIPHQANARIIETTGNLLKISSEKVIVNIDKYGNTSAATIPIAFHEAITDGRIKRGDIVLFAAFGSGLTSGATVFRY